MHIGGNVNMPTTQIVLNLSEPVNRIDAAALANYDLRSAGLDGVFDTGDDVIYSPTARGCGDAARHSAR